MENLGGLTTKEAQELQKKFGFNELAEKKQSAAGNLVRLFFSPISLMLLAAAGLSFFDQKTFDGAFILVLLLINVGVSVWQEAKADDAIAKLNDQLKSLVKVRRDGNWQDLPTRELVAGDVVQLAAGEVVPADGHLTQDSNVSVSEAALTGESLPKEKKVGDWLFSGSFITTGIAVMAVTAIGPNTKFGKTVSAVETTAKKSFLEEDIIRISKFLSVLSLAGTVIITTVFFWEKVPLPELLTLGLSLIIAGIPVSLPTVMTLIIALGVLELSKKQAVVRRLSALEDLAKVDLLLTDKTGTLTKNQIVVSQMAPAGEFSDRDLMLAAYLASFKDERSLISLAIGQKFQAAEIKVENPQVLAFTPGDSVNKRTAATVKLAGKTYEVTAGAPQVIAALCDAKINPLAGARTIAVAQKVDGKFKLVGLLGLSDEVRPEAAEVMAFLAANQIEVAMVTGDNRTIAADIGRQLAIPGSQIVTKDQLEKLDWDNLDINFFRQTQAFAEIYPEDKLALVRRAKKFFTVATNGDGINDLPAVKEANVGIAVANAVSALKATADIVLLANGIAVIKDAIIEGRKIFSRLYTYSLYRLSESFRLIVTIVILGLIFRTYPLTPLQIILIALLNDIPIISLATDRVANTLSPAKINVRSRFVLSSLFGLAGVANSLLLFTLMYSGWHLAWPIIQTAYFLKLTVSGHLLIYVAHTKERWWRWLPSRPVIAATTITQLAASIAVFFGLFMPAALPLSLILFVWLWSLLWMQITELAKAAYRS
ncbi:MAG: HAD-IC family P-type ATPase [Patescibacteria group bacterium]|nr:HAD-IC family P-type ATPase [Patescibacteria group bacterium]MCL5432258.1 HAD-IC family P-type ATPase [Patescibacteria group bacterium]